MAQLTQVAKIVGCKAPIDSTGTVATSKIVGLKKYDQCTFLLYIGNLAADVTLTVQECDDTTPTTATARAFNYRKASAGAAAYSELDGTLTAATNTGITIAGASDDNKLIAVEVKASDLTNGYPYVRLALSTPGANAALECVIAILTSARYLKDVPPSAID